MEAGARYAVDVVDDVLRGKSTVDVIEILFPISAQNIVLDDSGKG